MNADNNTKHHGDLKTLKSLIKNQEIKIDSHGKDLDFRDNSQDIHIHKRKLNSKTKIEFRIPLNKNYGEVSDKDRSNPLYDEVRQVLGNEIEFKKFAAELKEILKKDASATGKQARQVVNRLRKYFGLSFSGSTTVKKYTNNKLSMYAMRLSDNDNKNAFYYFIITANYIRIGDDEDAYFDKFVAGNEGLSNN